MEFRTLRADEIETRIAQISRKKTGLQLLLYKDARCDMSILDETVGAENWQRRHDEHRGNLFCSVGIRCADETGVEWVWKEDAGAESNTEAEKGHASDSFKRACVNWGIGRELYTAPFIWVPSNLCAIEEADGGGKTRLVCRDSFSVEEIEYDNRRTISYLRIVNKKTGAVVFGFGKKQTESARRAEVGRCKDCGMLIADVDGIPAEKTLKAALKRWNEPVCYVCAQKRIAAEAAT